MYTDGFVVAVILGLAALLLPVLWIAWWLVAELGGTASDTRTISLRSHANDDEQRVA